MDDIKNNKLVDQNKELILPFLEKEITKRSKEDSYSEQITNIEWDEKKYIGILKIESINILLPLANEWTEENAKYSPCLYMGENYNDKLIIAGHAIKSLFGNLNKMKKGEEVVIIDLYGTKYIYEAVNIEIIDGSDTEKMTDTDYDLTLFTCTNNNSARLAIRCNRVN